MLSIEKRNDLTMNTTSGSKMNLSLNDRLPVSGNKTQTIKLSRMHIYGKALTMVKSLNCSVPVVEQ